MSIMEGLELPQTSLFVFPQIHIPLHKLIPAARITMKVEQTSK